MTETKTCTKCGEAKPATTEFFYKNRLNKDGLKGFCKICNYEDQKIYRIKNKEKLSINKKEHYQKNRDRIIRRVVSNGVLRRKTDYVFDIKHRISKLITSSINRNGYSKSSKTNEILCCDYESFVAHIEKQFLHGMTWENRSEWHIDHITPLATAKTEEDVIRLNHYTNLRPLWAIDNLKKGAKLDYHI